MTRPAYLPPGAWVRGHRLAVEKAQPLQPVAELVEPNPDLRRAIDADYPETIPVSWSGPATRAAVNDETLHASKAFAAYHAAVGAAVDALVIQGGKVIVILVACWAFAEYVLLIAPGAGR